jgi:hypothetical protein
VTRPGTSLSTFWKAPSAPGCLELLARVDAIKARLDAQVASGEIPGYAFAGFLWMQGEADANFGTASKAHYGADLADLIAAVGARVGHPLPAVAGRISFQNDPSVVRGTGLLRVSKAFGGPYPDDADFVNDGLRRGPSAYSSKLAAVRQAQEDVPDGWVDTDDFHLVDTWHFDSAGQLSLGRRFAAASLALP